MHDRETGPLNDALDREIEEMLAVDPSAAFESRVRARVAERHFASASWRWWGTAMRQGVAVAAVVLLAVAGWRLWDASERVGESQPSQVAGTELHPSVLVPPGASSEPSTASAASASAPGSRRAEAQRDLPVFRPSDPRTTTMVLRDWLPPVLVDPDEVAGMRALIADVQAGRFEMVVVSDDPPIAAPSPTVSTSARAATESVPQARPLPDDRTKENEGRVDDAGEPPRAAGVDDAYIEAERPVTQVAFATGVRPIVIAPVAIEPLVKSVPESSEGDAE
jgi:hypothetical protein